MPSSTPLINGKTNWEINLERSKEECDKADRELWPNRVALRARYNAQRMSFLETQRENERRAIDVTANFRRNGTGMYIPTNSQLNPYTVASELGSTLPVIPQDNPRYPTNYPARLSTPVEPVRNPLRYERPYYQRAEAEPAPYRYQQPKTDDSEYVVPNDEQKFIQRVGMNSNCNVNIQSKHYGMEYRMFCENCKAAQPIARSVVTKWDANQSEILSFCKAHRHDGPDAPLDPSAEGRKFRT